MSKTTTLIDCLYILSDEIASGDGVANQALRECADRMSKLRVLLDMASSHVEASPLLDLIKEMVE
jgi:hypothetical protein